MRREGPVRRERGAVWESLPKKRVDEGSRRGRSQPAWAFFGGCVCVCVWGGKQPLSQTGAHAASGVRLRLGPRSHCLAQTWGVPGPGYRKKKNTGEGLGHPRVRARARSPGRGRAGARAGEAAPKRPHRPALSQALNDTAQPGKGGGVGARHSNTNKKKGHPPARIETFVLKMFITRSGWPSGARPAAEL